MIYLLELNRPVINDTDEYIVQPLFYCIIHLHLKSILNINHMKACQNIMSLNIVLDDL